MFCTRCHREYRDDYQFCPYDGAATSKVPVIDQVRASPTRLTDAMLGDRYVVRGFIGKGGVARVYLAEDIETGHPVAVKVLDRSHADDASMRARFEREAKAIASIGHPNIVTIHEIGEREEDGLPYLVMEFLFGEPAGDLLRREGALPLEKALPLLRQAASALEAAHASGVVHRDVKLDNLYVLGEPGRAYDLKVIDFGFAKVQASDLTASGSVIGTPDFMAPEQVAAEDVDARTDVYGLGVVMYRMLTGARPFDVSDDVEMLAHQLLVSPPRPCARLATLDPRAERVIMAAMRKEPAQRYPSMHALFEDMGRLTSANAELRAPPRSDDEEDVYVPRSTVARHVGIALARAIGVGPPPWADSLAPSSSVPPTRR